MPHRVANFFRSSSDSVNTVKASVQQQRRRSPNSRANTTSSSNSIPRPGSTRTISYPSSAEEDANPSPSGVQSHSPAVRMPELARDKELKESSGAHRHRLSFPGLGHLVGGSKSKEPIHTTSHQHPHASLDWKIESPPAVMYGDAENSTGALVSGQFLLAVKEEPFEIESFDARLEIHVIQKKPFQNHCVECANQTTELKTWRFHAEPIALDKRPHEYPFSALLEGHLPASTDNSLVSVRYDLIAEVKPKTGPTIKLLKTINVKRALAVPETPHHSIRIFPPTNITATIHYPQVVHPIGNNKLELRLNGNVKSNEEVKTVEYWKLKRVSWKLEEHINTVAPACKKHSPKDSEPADSAKKGLKRTETRIVGSGDMASGWKADYSPGGSVEMELEYQCNPASKVVCDTKSRDGTEITHQLVVEMVVAQEYAPTTQIRHATPTGVARILRMHFNTTLTERAGLGVSWDNEAPPIYQDVPLSPPSYLCDIPYEEVEGLSHLDDRSSGENVRNSVSSP